MSQDEQPKYTAAQMKEILNSDEGRERVKNEVRRRYVTAAIARMIARPVPRMTRLMSSTMFTAV